MITLSGKSQEGVIREAAELFCQTTLSVILSRFVSSFSTGFHTDDSLPVNQVNTAINLTCSPPFLKTEANLVNEATKHSIHEFFPQTYFQLATQMEFQLIIVRISKFTNGRYSFLITVNGLSVDNGVKELEELEELEEHYTNYTAHWPEFDFAQTLILEPRKVSDQEYWRTESLDPISEVETHGRAATCAAEQTLEPFHYLLYEPGNRLLIKISSFLAISGGLLFIFWPLLGGFFLFLAICSTTFLLAAFFKTLSYQKEKFKYTLLTPGIITSVKPVKVLVLAPIAKSSFAPDKGDSFKYLEDIKLPGHKIEVGTRIPVASSFTESSNEPDYWSDFEPEPICWGVSNKAKLKAAEKKLGDNEFKILENYWNSGRIPKNIETIIKARDLPPEHP